MYLRISNLTKKYGEKEVLSGYNLEAATGVCRISGPSGSGKTTLLRILLGLEDGDSGSIMGYRDGKAAAEAEAAGGDDLRAGSRGSGRGFFRDLGGLTIAAVFQEDRLLEHLDALGNLRFALGRSQDAEPLRSQAAATLRSLGLDPDDRKPAREYSGGMKRRLALARALLSGADILALDEPLTGLDEANIAAATELIEAYAKDHIVLLVSHIGA